MLRLFISSKGYLSIVGGKRLGLEHFRGTISKILHDLKEQVIPYIPVQKSLPQHQYCVFARQSKLLTLEEILGEAGRASRCCDKSVLALAKSVTQVV